MRLATIGLLTALGLFSVKAADLTTRDGTVYRDYHVVSSDPGYLTILYVDGGGRIPLANLPPDLQRQYHYDPVQAAAYIKQFEAQDQDQRVAVQAAQAPSPAAPAPVTAPVPVTDSASAPPADTSTQTWAQAPLSTSFTPGPDPLAPGGDVLAQSAGSTDSSDSPDTQEEDADYFAGYDDSGGLWVSSFDADGKVHWYRWDRRFDGREGDLWRLDGNRDLPANALVTLDHSGRWVVTYLDDHGRAQRFYRNSEAPRADTKTGAWIVVVNGDGSRSLRPEHEEHQPPPHFAHYAYIDHRATRPGESYSSNGYNHTAHTPYVTSRTEVAGDNVHPGTIPPPNGSRPATSQGSSAGSSTPHGLGGSTVHPAPVTTPPTLTGH